MAPRSGARSVMRWVLALAVLYGCTRSHPTEPPPGAVGPRAPLASDEDLDEPDPATVREWLGAGRFAIRPGDQAPVRGSSEALVRVVVFEDYTARRSAALAKAYGDALARWPDDVQVVLVHAPSQMTAMARPLAELAIAAGGQGKFWEAHDRLLLSPPTDREAMFELAGRLGLDVQAVRDALADGRHRAWIDHDVEIARSHGVGRGSVAFVNGLPVRDEELVDVVARERELARRLVAAGIPRARLHSRIAELLPAPPPLATADPSLGDGVNWAVPAGEAPVLGPKDALVTIVVFSDFQCPFCGRVQPTLAQLRERHPEDVRLVFRHMPLAMHPQARLAAKAAFAADRQGKFWRMHDFLFGLKGAPDERALRLAVKRLRLDKRRFDRDRKSAAAEAAIAEDERIGHAFGVRGTPAFFVNGRSLSGAQPIETFEALVAEELGKAREFVASDPGGEGTPYDRMLDVFVPAPAPKR